MPTTCFVYANSPGAFFYRHTIRTFIIVFLFVLLSPIAFYLNYHIVQCQTAHDATVCISSCYRCKFSNFYFFPFAFHIAISIAAAKLSVQKGNNFGFKLFCHSYRFWFSCKFFTICHNKTMQAKQFVSRAAGIRHRFFSVLFRQFQLMAKLRSHTSQLSQK